MIGDSIELKKEYIAIAKEIFLRIQPLLEHNKKLVVAVAGESGSGKSITAHSLAFVLENNGIKTTVLQMDDYFVLPPKTNHLNRMKNIKNVGSHEVNLLLLEHHIHSFKDNINEIQKPLVNYPDNTISNENICLEAVEVLLVEGTYVMSLEGVDFSIFIDRNYQDTYQDRMQRNRDEKSDFVEKVLAIEHQIIAPYHKKANLILDQNFKIFDPNETK